MTTPAPDPLTTPPPPVPPVERLIAQQHQTNKLLARLIVAQEQSLEMQRTQHKHWRMSVAGSWVKHLIWGVVFVLSLLAAREFLQSLFSVFDGLKDFDFGLGGLGNMLGNGATGGNGVGGSGVNFNPGGGTTTGAIGGEIGRLLQGLGQ